MLSFQRCLGRELSLVVIKFASHEASARISALSARIALAAAYPSRATALRSNAKGIATLKLAPQSVAVFTLRS